MKFRLSVSLVIVMTQLSVSAFAAGPGPRMPSTPGLEQFHPAPRAVMEEPAPAPGPHGGNTNGSGGTTEQPQNPTPFPTYPPSDPNWPGPNQPGDPGNWPPGPQNPDPNWPTNPNDPNWPHGPNGPKEPQTPPVKIPSGQRATIRLYEKYGADVEWTYGKLPEARRLAMEAKLREINDKYAQATQGSSQGNGPGNPGTPPSADSPAPAPAPVPAPAPADRAKALHQYFEDQKAAYLEFRNEALAVVYGKTPANELQGRLRNAAYLGVGLAVGGGGVAVAGNFGGLKELFSLGAKKAPAPDKNENKPTVDTPAVADPNTIDCQDAEARKRAPAGVCDVKLPAPPAAPAGSSDITAGSANDTGKLVPGGLRQGSTDPFKQ